MCNPLSCPFSPNMKKCSSCKEQLVMLCQANCWRDAYSMRLCPHTHIYFKIRPCYPVRQCADLDLYGSATELAGCDLYNTRADLKVADTVPQKQILIKEDTLC